MTEEQGAAPEVAWKLRSGMGLSVENTDKGRVQGWTWLLWCMEMQLKYKSEHV